MVDYRDSGKFRSLNGTWYDANDAQAVQGTYMGKPIQRLTDEEFEHLLMNPVLKTADHQVLGIVRAERERRAGNNLMINVPFDSNKWTITTKMDEPTTLEYAGTPISEMSMKTFELLLATAALNSYPDHLRSMLAHEYARRIALVPDVCPVSNWKLGKRSDGSPRCLDHSCLCEFGDVTYNRETLTGSKQISTSGGGTLTGTFTLDSKNAKILLGLSEDKIADLLGIPLAPEVQPESVKKMVPVPVKKAHKPVKKHLCNCYCTYPPYGKLTYDRATGKHHCDRYIGGGHTACDCVDGGKPVAESPEPTVVVSMEMTESEVANRIERLLKHPTGRDRLVQALKQLEEEGELPKVPTQPAIINGNNVVAVSWDSSMKSPQDQQKHADAMDLLRKSFNDSYQYQKELAKRFEEDFEHKLVYGTGNGSIIVNEYESAYGEAGSYVKPRRLFTNEPKWLPGAY